jgi:hypothetical protein
LMAVVYEEPPVKSAPIGDHLRRASAVTGRLKSSFGTLGKLILPEVFEPVRRQGRVADRGHDRSVAEIGLDGASVVAVVEIFANSGPSSSIRLRYEFRE